MIDANDNTCLLLFCMLFPCQESIMANLIKEKKTAILPFFSF